MSEALNVGTREIVSPYDRDAYRYSDELYVIGNEIVEVSLDSDENPVVVTDPWLFTAIAREQGYDIEHGEALDILESIINEKSDRLETQARTLEMVGIYYDEDTNRLDKVSFSDTFYEEFGRQISESEMDVLEDIAHYRSKEKAS